MPFVTTVWQFPGTGSVGHGGGITFQPHPSGSTVCPVGTGFGYGSVLSTISQVQVFMSSSADSQSPTAGCSGVWSVTTHWQVFESNDAEEQASVGGGSVG